MVRLLHEHWRRHKAHVPSWNWDQKLSKRCYSHHDIAAASITEGTTFVFVQVYCSSNEASALEGRSIFRLLALSKIVRMWFDDFRFRLLCAELQPSSQANPAAFELLKIESRESKWCSNLIDGLSSSPRRIQPDIDLPQCYQVVCCCKSSILCCGVRHAHFTNRCFGCFTVGFLLMFGYIWK